MTFDTAEMKSRMSCVELAQHMGLPIHKSGDRCRSPFHDGKNPSSMVVTNEFWYSFSDQKGGDQIELLAEIEFRGDRGLAIEKFAQLTGMSRDFDCDSWRKETKEIEHYVEKCHKQLRQYDREYLYSRGIQEDTIKRLKIGFDQGRLVIPYLKNDRPYNWISRTLTDKGPKYKKKENTDYTDYSPWGMHTINRNVDTLYITEGAFDAMSIDQEGYSVLSTMGSSFGEKNKKLVIGVCKRFKNIVLAFDNDKSGRDFAKSFAKDLMDARLKFRIAMIPEPYKDVSDYYTAGNKIKDMKTVEGLSHLAQFIQDEEEFKSFGKKAARYCDAVDIATILTNATNFSAYQIKALKKEITTAPSESAIADELIKKMQLLYVDQDGFYAWDKLSWKKLADVIIKQYADEAYGVYSTANRCNAVCTLLKARVAQTVEFDRKPVLTFTNGTLELETGIFRDVDPLDYCTIRMSYPYVKEENCPQWKSFIHEITNGVEQTMRVLKFIAGYVLFPDCRFQKIFALIGKGGNGKSVYLDVLRTVFGPAHCSNIEPDKLTSEFYPILLKETLLNLGTEIDGDFSKAEKMLKQISAGETIMGCYKGMTHIQFNPRCKLVYACNELPRASVVKGLDRRMVFVDFPCKFVDCPDPNNPFEKQKDIFIYSKLLQELSGIFNWVYEGYKELMDAGSFEETADQERYMQQFQEISNPIMVFCEDHDFVGSMTKDEIYQMYVQWCEHTGNRQLSREVFFPRFREHMGSKIIGESRPRRNGKRIFIIEFAIDPLAFPVIKREAAF